MTIQQMIENAYRALAVQKFGNSANLPTQPATVTHVASLQRDSKKD